MGLALRIIMRAIFAPGRNYDPLCNPDNAMDPLVALARGSCWRITVVF